MTESWQCAEGYVKCPRAYCIAVEMVCDGYNDCPGGQDEFSCGQVLNNDHCNIMIRVEPK